MAFHTPPTILLAWSKINILYIILTKALCSFWFVLSVFRVSVPLSRTPRCIESYTTQSSPSQEPSSFMFAWLPSGRQVIDSRAEERDTQSLSHTFVFTPMTIHCFLTQIACCSTVKTSYHYRPPLYDLMQNLHIENYNLPVYALWAESMYALCK